MKKEINYENRRIGYWNIINTMACRNAYGYNDILKKEIIFLLIFAYFFFLIVQIKEESNMKIIGRLLGTTLELGLVWWMGALTIDMVKRYDALEKDNERLEVLYANACTDLDNAEKYEANLRKQVSSMQSRLDRAKNLING